MKISWFRHPNEPSDVCLDNRTITAEIKQPGAEDPGDAFRNGTVATTVMSRTACSSVSPAFRIQARGPAQLIESGYSGVLQQLLVIRRRKQHQYGLTFLLHHGGLHRHAT